MRDSRHTAQEEVLSMLRHADGCISGEELSRCLGISRTAIWKHIRALRSHGYEIRAASGRGYRLVQAPDLLSPAEIQNGLNTRFIAQNVQAFDQIDSTNHQAMLMGEEGVADGTVVIADVQSSGKGRLGRRWASPAGVNLYASIVLRPPIAPHRAPQLTFVSAVAVAQAINSFSGMEARVKWPNDILIDDCKVGGLLNEMSAESERVHFVVLGIGLNVNMTASQFPDDLRYPATSLFLSSGRKWPRAELARHLFEKLEQLYHQYLNEGFEPVLRQWESLCCWRGRVVEVDRGTDRIRGRFAGLDQTGALLLDAGGTLEKIYSGDVRSGDD
jgi:BirA family biotin operon repressor/biotin-[acetyl-CoA-carboxylase] ligase